MPDILPFLRDLDTHQLLGLLGFCMYVTNYCCLSFRVLTSESALFFVINTLAASLVLISLTTDFNLASVLIQGFWIVIGTCAIVLRVHRRLRRARDRSPIVPPAPQAQHPMLRTEPADESLKSVA